MVRKKRIAPILKLNGVRIYTETDVLRAFVGKDNLVYAVRKTSEKKFVKVDPDGTLTDLYTFSNNCYGGFKAANGTILVGVSTRISATSNYPTEIWRSTDGGTSFTKVFTTTVGGPIYWSWAEDAAGNIYFSEYGYKVSNVGANARYMRKSTDGGLTWNIVFDTGGMYDSHIHCIGVDPFDNSLYVSVGDTATRQAWRSTDGGQNWTKISSTRQHINMLFLPSGILWGSDDHTGEITLMERGTWQETVVYKHMNHECMYYGLSMDITGNIYAHGVDEVNNKHYTVIGSPDLSVWRDLDCRTSWRMTPFVTGKTYCDGYIMSKEQTSQVMPVRT